MPFAFQLESESPRWFGPVGTLFAIDPHRTTTLN